MPRYSSKNPNWKSGICSINHVDEILNLPTSIQNILKAKLNDNSAEDEDSGCWEWTGSVFKSSGRARVSVGQRSHLAYRVAYVVYIGPIGKLCVLHDCDNKICINPKHLWLGTNADNSFDMVCKNRHQNQDGSSNPMAKLDEEKVKEIKIRIREGHNQRKIARDFRVSFQTISLIGLGKTWRHVEI